MIGPHIIGSISNHFQVLERWQPRSILVLDPSPDQIRTLRQICPNTFIVGRVYREDREVDQRIRANPIDAAQWAHQAIMERFAPEVDAWQVENEVLQQWDGLPLLNTFALERMRLADAHGYKAAILAFSVGNPDLPSHDRMAHWRLVGPALAYAEQHNHVVVVHQYGSPTLWQPDSNWYIHRLENQVLPLLPHSRVQFVCTEFGVDNLINNFRPGPSGWQDTMSSPQQYAQDLINIGQHLERYKDRILGYCVYTLGHNAPWQTYDIAGDVANYLANHYQNHAQPPIVHSALPAILHPAGQPAIDAPTSVAAQPFALATPAFQAGDIGQVAALCRVRRDPGLQGEALGLLEPGFAVSIIRGPQVADGLLWWRVFGVMVGGIRVIGWVAQQDPTGAILLQKPPAELAQRLIAPFDGRFPLSQFFGENPTDYVRFSLRGHNGLDFGMQEGVPIRAVDAGWAFQVQNDPPGYGNFVKLQHTWGETIYAHLSRHAIQPGQQVVQGQIIGFSGSTGNVTGPHLHFAIRIAPYNISDGWLGYSDPLFWVSSRNYALPFAADA